MAITRRRIALTTFGTGTTALLAACAPGSAGAPQSTLSKEPISLRWSTWGNATSPMVQAAEKGLALFKEKFPNVTVTPEPQVNTPNGPLWTDKHIAEWIAGTGPDVTGNNSASLIDWGRQPYPEKLDDLIKRDAKAVPLSDYATPYLNLLKSTERGQFALPMYMGITTMYYSKALFQKRGVPLPDNTWDWNKMEDAMRRLTTAADAPDRSYGYMLFPNIAMHGIYIRQAGGNEVDPKDNRKAVFHSPEALKALQWIHDRMWKDRSLPKNTDIEGPTSAGGFGLSFLGAVRAGKLGMATQGSQDFVKNLLDQPEAVDGWDIALLPKGPAQRDTGHTLDAWLMASAGKKKDASWELMKFLQSDPWIEIAASVVGHQPARKSWQDKFVGLLKKQYPALANKNLSAFTEPITAGFARPNEFFLKHAEAVQIWTAASNATFVNNTSSVSDAFRKAAEDVNRLHGV
jgi:multiple sugar transport system substrate-binding protein